MLTINNTIDGYLKDIEIKGNTIQDINQTGDLADIRSVGDKLENQELYEIPVLITNGLDSSDSKYEQEKITILSPKTLKSYNGTKDRIVCKNNVWVHEENVTYDAEGNGTVLSIPIDTALPYDQQVKLRTFANKTNISFGCEIEPTLKASVPKSIGASVSSNTTQIDNLSKELEKINNLEESVTSEVISESDFITVENTSNGYFEDVKLEGRTLVNLFNAGGYSLYDNCILISKNTIDFSKLKSNTVYTGVLFDNTNKILYTSMITNIGDVNIFSKMYDKVFTFKTPQDLSSIQEKIIKLYSYADVATKPLVATDIDKIKFMILEGDHTQNPPEFFEGLKSVGQDVDEISVLTQNKEETKENEKRILYYNDETQTWEKPILREWDSIEKHSDGKYYYHKRSGEVVLNGSESSWSDSSATFNLANTMTYHVQLYNYTTKPKSIICDKFISDIDRFEDIQGIYNSDGYIGATRILFRVNKTTHDTLNGFKAWLQANPVTVVYQLAEEKVYECTNLDLITYQNKTNLLVKSGVLNPKVTLKVKKGIGNVVTMLQNKVAMLEDLVNKLIQK